MEKISESLLDELAWMDFSIIIDRDKKCILILICKDAGQKAALYDMLSNYEFAFGFLIEEDQTITLILKFFKAEIPLTQATNLTEEGYKSLIWLKEGLVKYITTGLWLADGVMSDYYTPSISLFLDKNHN